MKKYMKVIAIVAGLCLLGAALMACGSSQTSPSPSPSASASASPAASNAPSATPAASSSPSASPAASNAPSASPSASSQASSEKAENLALGKTATVSNQNSKDTKEKALDGDVSTKWRCNGPSDPNTYITFAVDFGKATTFNKVVLKNLHNVEKYKQGSGKIEYSDDGQNWKEAAKIEKFVADETTVTFNPVTARYVRLYADKAMVEDNTIGFGEFEVYNVQ